MNKKVNDLTKNIASSRNWFRPELLPDAIELQHQIVIKPTTVQNYDGLKLLFVEDGSGILVANGKTYSLQRGTCCLLYCFHFHKIIPAPTCTLKIRTCYISYNTFLFASIVPGYYLTEIEQSQLPIAVNFSEEHQVRIWQILSAMENPCATSGYDLQHALLFECLGRLCREYMKQHGSSPDN